MFSPETFVYGKVGQAVPYLRFKGFEEEFLRREQGLFVDEFSRIAAVPREIVKIEQIDIKQITPTPRSLEIYMFPRTQEKHNAIARNINALLCHFGYRDVHIFFVLLTPSLYYKKGLPLKNIDWLQENTPTGKKKPSTVPSADMC